MQIDASKSALANVLALVSATNPGAIIAANQVTAAAPTVKEDTGDGRNTSVAVTGVPGRGFTNTKTLNYIRRPFNDSVTSPDFDYAGTVGDTAAVVLAAICTANGLLPAEVKLQNAGVDVTGPITTSPATLTLVVVGTSLIYLPGSTQAITCTWTAAKIDLASAVAVTKLNGFSAAS